MPRRDYKTCRNCRRHEREVGAISCSRLCADCASAILLDNIDGIHNKRGVAWARWRVGMAVSAIREPAVLNALIDAGVFAYSPEHTEV